MLQFPDNAHQTIQPHLKQIRRPPHPRGAIEIRAGCDHADDTRTQAFRARPTRSHFLTNPGSILSTYLARMSNSRFIKSPACARSRLVCFFVYGTIQATKLLGRISATVRLIPLTAIEPFKVVYWANLAGSSISNRKSAPLFRKARTGDTQSTCPCTKCPPKRSFAPRARSRFTESPRCRCFRFVRAIVSAKRSNPSVLPRRELTVRQQPLMATLSPRRIFFARYGAAIFSSVPSLAALTEITL